MTRIGHTDDDNGILYAKSRICKENLFLEIDTDTIPFLDLNELIKDRPVILSDSPKLYAYAVHVHLKIRVHSGIEATYKEIQKKLFVPQGLKRLIHRI